MFSNATIIEGGNWLFMIVSAYGCYSAVKWRIHQHITLDNQAVISAWVWMFAAIGVYTSWFAISRQTAPPGEIWNPEMIPYRWILVALTSLAFTIGMISFIRNIEGFGIVQFLATCIVAVLAALAMGYF